MRYYLSGTAHRMYPMDCFYAILTDSDGNEIEIPKKYPFAHEWGHYTSIQLHGDGSVKPPTHLEMIYLSAIEEKFYEIEKDIDIVRFEKQWNEMLYVIIGMAPYGGVALWLSGDRKSVIFEWMKGQESDVDMEDFVPTNPTISLKEYCDFYIKNDSEVKANLEENGLPSRDLFDNFMKQFTYRYQVMMEKWMGEDEEVKWKKYTEEEEVRAEFDWIEEALYDGTHDKLRDGGLMKFHEAGKPKKLAVQFHQGKSEYTAYFWFDETGIREVFDRFYGAHPETKTDFIIRIDPEKKKYELALFRYGLKEPVIIREDAYQLIVFKNQFEDHRSENYNQPRGAWIW